MLKVAGFAGLVAVLGLVATAPAPAASGARTELFVVVLAPGGIGPRAEANRLTREYGGRVGRVYSHALRGFSV